MRCVSETKKFVSTYNTKGWAMTYVATPNVSVEQTDKGILISWNKIAGATGYRVFVKTENGWSKLADVKGTSHLYAGKEGEYSFTVRCIDGNKWFNSYYDTVGVSSPAVDLGGDGLAQTGLDIEATTAETSPETVAQTEQETEPETQAATEPETETVVTE